MVGYDGAGAIHAVRMRLTRLSASGAPLAGPNSMLVTSALTQASFTPQKATGQEIEQRNASDEVCVYYKAPDTLKSINFSLTLCTPDPQVSELLAGGTVLTGDGGAPVGYAAPQVGVDGNPNGVSIELWSRAIIDGAQASDLPWMQWVFPRESLSQDQSDFANAAQLPAFSGAGRTNPNWGAGPAGDWEYDSDRLWQWARVANLPAITDGWVAVTGT